MYNAVLCSIFKFDHLSPYSLIDHFDFKFTTKLNFPALFMSRLSGELYQCIGHEIVFALLRQAKKHTILPKLSF